MVSEVNISAMAEQVEPCHQYLIMAAEGQSDRMVSDMEVQMKQSHAIELI